MKLMRKCLCLFLVLTSMLSIVCLGPAVNTFAAASAYISTTYASNLNVKTTSVTSLYDVPSANGALRYTIAKDTLLRVKALHKNISGEYWYEIQYYNLTLYVLSKDTTMVSHLTGDVNAKNLQSPAALKYGSGFPIGGEVSSVYNDIGEIRASLYKGSYLTREPALTSADTVNGKYYNLTNSTVDTNLWFNMLSAGVYTYVVKAEAVSWYIDDNDALSKSSVDVFVENKQCAVTNKANPNPVLHRGIDVSVWNGDIDWAAVSNQVDFVIIRASWEETADTKFSTNAKGCEANGIPYGVYVYSYAETEAEAIGEAKYVLSLVDGYDMELPIYFDFEDEVQMSLSTDMKKKVVRAFCDTIYAAGYQPGIYTYKWVLTSVLTDAYFKTLPTWVAEINGANYTSYDGGLTMWQYSWTGRFTGMSGDVDCNYMYVELPGKHSSDTSYLSRCEYYPSNLSVTLNADANVREYPSTDYSLLKSLGKGTKLHVTGLYKNAYGNYWYQIETDGVTGYIGSELADINEYLFDDISIQNPDMASNLDSGKGYYIRGDLSSVYNNLTTVYARVYSGEDTSATPVLSSSYSPNSKSYSLYKSEVDYGLPFGSQSTGYYTYEISADVKNYSARGTTLSSKTENVVLWTTPYTVNNATVTPPASTACTHKVVTQAAVAPTCTETGLTEGSYCSLCNVVFATQTEIPAKGHNYISRYFPATCIDFEHTLYTCLNCGHSYTETSGNVFGEWSETKPEGVDESLIETKTQYRHSDYEMIKSYDTALEGYTLINKEWESQGTKTQVCVKEWPSGFDKTHSLYSQYGKTPAKDYTDTYYVKQEVNSEKIVGYVYYHWCSGQYNDGPYNRTISVTKTDEHPTFHAFYSTKSPSESEREASDGSVIYSNLACCGDSYWYYNIPVYEQTYTDYKALYTHSIWHPFTEWSDEEVTASWDRNVETRTLYRYVKEGSLGDHSFDNGVCTVCGTAQPEQDMCLFGYINGFDYADKEDYEYLGAYCFKDGKLVTTFTEDSYVAVKTADNERWYMTNGYPGEHVTSVMLYNTDVLEYNGDKLFVPKGREITFTLEKCDNDTYILSYTAAPCYHEKHNTQGECVACGESTEHNYSHGGCIVCGATCNHEFADGVCRICFFECTHDVYESGICSACGYKCEHDFVNGICTICACDCYHQWIDGKCTICRRTCEPHDYKDGACRICGKLQPGYFLVGMINGKEINGEDYVFENGTLDVNFTEDSLVYIKNSDDVSFMFAADSGEDTTISVLYSTEIIGDAGYKLTVPGGRNVRFTVMDNGDDTITVIIAVAACKHTNHTAEGVCTECHTRVEHRFTAEGVCSVCSKECTHTFKNGICSTCGYRCEHSFRFGTCTVCGVRCQHNFVDGVCSDCLLVCGHSYLDSECTDCGKICEHEINGGACTICDKNFGFTLAGFINGKYVGCEDDFHTVDAFGFSNMKTTLTTTENSFVFVKTTGNEYMYLAKDTVYGNSAALYNSDKADAQDLLYVPAGVEAEFTLSFGADDTVILSYEIIACSHIERNNGGICKVCGDEKPVPQVNLKYASLSLEEKLYYTVYFDTLNLDGIAPENMGIALFDTPDFDGTIDRATKTYSGVRNENGYFAVNTDNMYAHTLGDSIYFKAYVKLADGSYIYSDIMSFSGKQYAMSVINNPVSTKEEKALMVSLLNYGAELQKYYDYKTEDLMNSELTDAQKEYAKAYDPSMVDKTERVPDEKTGEFRKTGKGVSFYPIVRYNHELFGFELVLKAKDSVGDAYLYYWEEDTYSSADVLTAENVTGRAGFSNYNGQYNISIYSISAATLNSPLYFTMKYKTEDSTEYCTGILAYSLAEFMKTDAGNVNSENHELAKAALVYAYYAKNFFGN